MDRSYCIYIQIPIPDLIHLHFRLEKTKMSYRNKNKTESMYFDNIFTKGTGAKVSDMKTVKKKKMPKN